MKADFEKGTKVCSKCRRELPISEFCKSESSNDGLRCYCKKCESNRICAYAKSEKGKETMKRSGDKAYNTFGRVGHRRGNNGIVKRDYELTEQQLARRNKNREIIYYRFYSLNR